jgi:hypothetical protein
MDIIINIALVLFVFVLLFSVVSHTAHTFGLTDGASIHILHK